MKKVLIYEYFTGGGIINEELCSSSLLSEAKIIVNSVVNEYCKSQEYQVYYFLDSRLKLDNLGKSIEVKSSEQLYDIKLLRTFDLILPILPEQNMELYSYCEFLAEQNIETLISSPETIKVLSDKYVFSSFCLKHNIPCIPSYLSSQINAIPHDTIIEKDRYGVGCSHVKKISKKDSIKRKKMIYQPYIKGNHFSLCVYYEKKSFKILTLNEQDIVLDNNKIKLRSLKVNVKNSHYLELYSILRNIYKSLPGLYAYVGVDLIMTRDKILVVEVNPRLTTSFTGISSTLGINMSQPKKFMKLSNINPRSQRIYLS
tara:strand:- start:215 stop:1156 length:942 start_codon:yes stop_codon:yes gene_type:complete